MAFKIGFAALDTAERNSNDITFTVQQMHLEDHNRILADYNGYFSMSDMDEYHAYKSTVGKSGGSSRSGGGKGFGYGWVVIVVVAILLILLIAQGGSWDAIDSLLSMGLIAFLFFRWIST